jgi:hypothetical protein
VHDAKGNPKKKAVINEKEAEIVRRIFTLYVRDSLGGVEIAKRLNQDGKLRRGNRWTNVAVLRVLEDECCVGRYYYDRYDSRNERERPRDEWIMVPVPPIITDDLFAQAAAVRKSKSPERNPGRILAAFMRGRSCSLDYCIAGTVAPRWCRRRPRRRPRTAAGCTATMPASAT